MKVIEHTVLPNDDPPCRAAVGFLAVLTYPSIEDADDRDAFVEACWASTPRTFDVVRRAAEKRLRRRDVERRLSKAERIINRQRLPAARAAAEVKIKRAFDGTWLRFDFEDRVTKLGERFAAEIDVAPGKFYQRIWQPTLPVMHLAMALHSHLLVSRPERPTFDELIWEPRWVLAAITRAEQMRPWLIKDGIVNEPVNLVSPVNQVRLTLEQ